MLYQQSSEKSIAAKTRRIAWLPNRCSQNDDPFLNRLRQLLDVDIIGSCSINYGPCYGQVLSNISSQCSNFLKSNYLFVLTTDEYFCDHYLSPDVVRIISMKLVPIVVSGYNKLVHLPEGAYIADSSYNADYYASQINKIQNLSSTELFKKYFFWRKGKVVHKLDPLCDLSNKIEKVSRKTDEHEDWITEEFRCYPDWISYGGRKKSSSFINNYYYF